MAETQNAGAWEVGLYKVSQKVNPGPWIFPHFGCRRCRNFACPCKLRISSQAVDGHDSMRSCQSNCSQETTTRRLFTQCWVSRGRRPKAPFPPGGDSCSGDVFSSRLGVRQIREVEAQQYISSRIPSAMATCQRRHQPEGAGQYRLDPWPPLPRNISTSRAARNSVRFGGRQPCQRGCYHSAGCKCTLLKRRQREE